MNIIKKSIEQVNSTVLYTILYFCEEEDNADVLETINRLSKDTNIQFIKVSDSIPDWEQLLIMSCCQHNIIANSTFSWWVHILIQIKIKLYVIQRNGLVMR